jgi:hypothetical protein
MGKPLPGRDVRRKAFLRALAVGATVAAASRHARIAWSTVYAWRRDGPKFRAAWDRAAALGRHPLAARVGSALIERAIDGVDEPVLRNGEIVGTRKRYSDRLLAFALESLRERRADERPLQPGPLHQPKVKVIIEPLGDHDDDEEEPMDKAATARPDRS